MRRNIMKIILKVTLFFWFFGLNSLSAADLNLNMVFVPASEKGDDNVSPMLFGMITEAWRQLLNEQMPS